MGGDPSLAVIAKNAMGWWLPPRGLPRLTEIGYRLGRLLHRTYFAGTELSCGFGDDLGAGGVGAFCVVTV